MNRKPDIFDRIMQQPIFNIFGPFYKKYKEVLLYLFFGGFAFSLNIGLFAWMNAFGINELVNNAICWCACVLFQFFSNRTWVFEGQVDGVGAFLKQMGNFVAGRIATLFIEEIILAVFITCLGMDAVAIKLVAQIVVIVLNYIISKQLVLKK